MAREAAAKAEVETRTGQVEPATAAHPRCQRRSRQVEILQQAVGQEHTGEGETRPEQLGQRSPGIFTAQEYFWMFYVPASQGHLYEIVKPGERAGPGQCHAILDAAANVDADSVTASNSTYEYAGIDASRPELLYTKTLTCAAACCRDRSSISLTSRGCPFEAFTGRWRQQTVHSVHGVARVAAEKAVSTRDFAVRMQSEHLYAVYGGYKEKGNRPYWLVWCIKAPSTIPNSSSRRITSSGAGRSATHGSPTFS